MTSENRIEMIEVPEKKYWLDSHRLLYISILLIVMWGGFMLFYYLKADEVTRDPCSICSERMGEAVVCTKMGAYSIPVSRVYYPNGTVYDEKSSVKLEDTIDPFGGFILNGTG